MRFGVNYTPRQGWFHSWLDFDPKAVLDDFQTIAELGADHVRIFGMWPLLQPNRTLIRPAAIEDIATTVRLAGECGLDSWVDVLQGHLSSFDFLPSWLSSWHQRNLYTDSEVIAAERELLSTVAKALRGIPGAKGLNLGNEFIQFAASRHPQQQQLDQEGAENWLKLLFAQLEEDWPAGIHSHTFDDDLWFDTTQPFTPQMAENFGDLTTIHSWVFGKVGPRYGKDSSELAWFARYLCELAAGWGHDNNRSLWLQEVGSPENYVSRDYSPQFVRDTLQNVLGNPDRSIPQMENLEAITWWCSHDVNSSLADFPYFEHTLGLIDEQGEIKAEGAAFRRVIQEWNSGQEGSNATSLEAKVPVPYEENPSREPRAVMEIAAEADSRDLTDANHDFFSEWVSKAQQGQVCRIVVTRPTGLLGPQEGALP